MNKHVLIHNIGHHDVYFSLSTNSEHTIVVPINVHMYSVSKYIYQVLIRDQVTFTQDTTRSDMFHLSTPIPIGKLAGKTVTHKKERITLTKEMSFTGILIPNIIPVLKLWKREYLQNNTTLSLSLITSGQDKDSFEAAQKKVDVGRSTRFVGSILQHCIAQTYPSIETITQHNAHKEDFTFAESPRFFRVDVLPFINRIRQEVVDHYKVTSEDWKNNFFVHLSLNTGTTPDIISTLNALTKYNPDFFHIETARSWPKKEFKATRIKNANFKQNPAVSIKEITCPIQKFTIQEMQRWHRDYTTIKKTRESKEHSTFFFRKGHKEVLALVTIKNTLANTSTEPYLSVRGVNLEVSLPTGSLCAERNAIGTALMNNPLLEREDILCVAVLSLAEDASPKLGPCGACQEWLSKIIEVNPNFTILTFDNRNCTKIYIDD